MFEDIPSLFPPDENSSWMQTNSGAGSFHRHNRRHQNRLTLILFKKGPIFWVVS